VRDHAILMLFATSTVCTAAKCGVVVAVPRPFFGVDAKRKNILAMRVHTVTESSIT
jgi:hypothetical protein